MSPIEPAEVIVINEQVTIPVSELAFRFSRSSGPGGQHVQRSDTRVELLFDIANSPSLTDDQRARIRARLGGYVDGTGMLHIFASATRSQLENRHDAVARFRAFLAIALRRQKRRVPTKPSRSARERRLSEKKTRSEVKSTRRKVGGRELD